MCNTISVADVFRRSLLKQLGTIPGQLLQQKARLSVKAQNEELMKKYVTEVETMVKGLQEFLEKAEMGVAEAESLASDCGDDKQLEDLELKLQGFVSSGEHHLGGAKAAKNKFSPM